MPSSPAVAALSLHCPENWQVKPLADVAFFQEGPGILAKDFRDAGVPLLRLKGVEGDYVTLDGCNFLDPEMVARKWSHFRVDVGDLLISTSASLGRVSVVTELTTGAVPYTGLIRFKPKDDQLLASYLKVFLGSSAFIEQAEAMASGSVIRHFGPSHIKQMAILVPPLDVQEQIGSVASSFDARIRLLRETNATLEAIAQALFKSWFVDFDPVRAKAEGRDPEGVPPEVADLFPSEFEDSELGEIPKGWHVSTLAEHVTAERGLSYKGAGLCGLGEGRPMHNLNSVYEGGGYKYPGIKFYSGDFKERHLAVAGDIIVANTEQGHEHRLIGFPAIVPAIYPEGLFSHHLYRVRRKPSSPLTQRSLYYLLMTPYVREQIIGCANGSTVNMLKSAGLEIPRFVCPSAELATAFEELAKPLHQRIEHNVQQADELADLRDTLLPRLMSGKLRIPEAPCPTA